MKLTMTTAAAICALTTAPAFANPTPDEVTAAYDAQLATCDVFRATELFDSCANGVEAGRDQAMATVLLIMAAEEPEEASVETGLDHVVLCCIMYP